MAPNGTEKFPAADQKAQAMMMFNGNQRSCDTLNPTVEDQVDSGTAGILQSPHVREGPGRIANAPVPSVFNDDRGSIHRLRVGGKRINILHSEPGIMRSGYLHPVTTYDFVVSGQVEVWVLKSTGTQKTVYSAKDSFEIPPYTPHILNFLTKCVLTEWWEQPGDARCWVYHPYRNIVDVQNSTACNSTGNHQLLIPQNDYDRDLLPASASFMSFCWFSVGIAVGAVFGVALNKRR
mmetsp:Transcript_130724/g.194791  ORF Transcript_130724/g.194791 Transcript_130724/m.194791 type:complete len:235 (+) Transcript_130724:23-727(+)